MIFKATFTPIHWHYTLKLLLCRHLRSEHRAPGGLLWLTFAGYVSLASQNPYPIIVYYVAK